MSLPLCDSCSGRTILCRKCQQRYIEKVISPIEIMLSRIFKELFENLGFSHAIETDDSIIIIAPKNDVGKIIGRGGEGIKKISEKTGIKIKIIGEDTWDVMVHDIVSPAKIESFREVYGLKKKYKIFIKNPEKLRIKPDNLSKLLSKISDTEVEIIVK